MNYPWKTISPKDTISILKFTILSDLHVKSLVSLYQPLLGKEAVSLYLILKEYIDQTVKKEMMLSDILIQLNCGVKEYYQARIKLEAYGLLRVFRHNSDESSSALALQAPMNPQQFFSDSMMKMMLIEKVGERLVRELEERFCVHSQDLEEYSEVTKSFLDVIHIDMKKMSETIENDESNDDKSESITDQAMRSDQFDWAFFVEGLNKHYISTSSLTKSTKKLIYTFHVIYDINELEMQKFVLEAADISSGKVDENKLTSLIQKRYLKQSKVKEAKEDDSSGINKYHVDQLKQKGFSTEEIEIILHAQQMNPYAYLKSIKQQKGGFVTSNETWLLKELVENAPLSTAVINILLNYLLIIKDAPTLEKSLATKIANDWAQSQVKSPEEAMQKVKQLYASYKEKQQQPQSRQSYPKARNKASHARKETLPDWATQTAEKDERLSTEEEAAFKEKLKRIRNKKSGES